MIRALACLLPLALCACAATSSYPSLARRPAERITGTTGVGAPAPRVESPADPPSVETTTRLAQLVEQVRAAHWRFAGHRAAAERSVGAAGTVASESWSVASIALAELEAARSEAMVPLASLDELYAAESVKAAETGVTSSADAARAAHDQASALIAEEDEVLDRLRARLRS